MDPLSSVGVKFMLNKSASSCNSKDANKFLLSDLGFSKIQLSNKNLKNSYYNDAIVGNTMEEDFSLQSKICTTATKTRPKAVGIKGRSSNDFDPLLKKNKSYDSNDSVIAAGTSNNNKRCNCYDYDYDYDYHSNLHLLSSSQVPIDYQPKPSKRSSNSSSNSTNVEEQQKQLLTEENSNISGNNKNKNHHRRNKSSPLPTISYKSLLNNNDSIDNNTKNSSNHRKAKSVPLYHSFGDYSIFKKKKASNNSNNISMDRTNSNNSTPATLLSSLVTKPSPTSFLTGKEKVVTTMNTMGPSAFKLEMPELEEFLFNIRLCQFMEDYRKERIAGIDLHETLAGIPRLHLQTFLSIGKLPYSASYNPRLIDDTCKPIIKSLLKCSTDVQLSYHTTEQKRQYQQPLMNSSASSRSSSSNSSGSYGNTLSSSSSSSSSNSSRSSSPIDDRSSTGDCSEVAIFQHQRQFVVVFKGTPSQQQKGGVAALFSSANTTKKLKSTLVPLSKDSLSSSLDDPQIYSCFRDAYMYMEKRIMQRLDNLIEENPFCDVVFIGHSFGGAIAQIAAVRYAAARSVIRVSCHVFGSPKVGNTGFANLANHSLPNLKVVRVEYKNDYTCQVPTAATASTTTPNGGEGCNIGHLVTINKSINSSSNNSKEDRKVVSKEDKKRKKESSTIVAYKFNKGNNNNNNNRKSITSFVSSRKKKNRGIEEYVAVLEGMECNGISWPKDYEGENIGEGVRGNNNEARTLA